MATKADYVELKDLADLRPQDSRYFVCNACRHWNLVKEEDLKDIFKPKKRVRKKDIHMKVPEDLALIVNKFARNFGGYTPMLAFLLNDFYKKHGPDNNELIVELQPEPNSQTIQTVPKPENPGNDKRNDQGNGEVHREIQEQN